MNFIRALGLRDVCPDATSWRRRRMRWNRTRGADGALRRSRCGPRLGRFFVPLGGRVLDAGPTLTPIKGAVYAWVPRAFGQGPRVSSAAGASGSTTPSTSLALLFGAANFAAMGGAPWEALARRAVTRRRVRADRHLGRRRGSTSSPAPSEVAAERRQPRSVDSPRRADRGAVVRVRALRLGHAVHTPRRLSRAATSGHIGLWSRCASLLGIRDHIADRPGNPRSRADDSPRHLHRRRGDDCSLHRRSASVLVAVPVSSLKELRGITDAVNWSPAASG